MSRVDVRRWKRCLNEMDYMTSHEALEFEHRLLCHADGSVCEDGCDREPDPREVEFRNIALRTTSNG